MPADSADRRRGALEGVRILDFSHALAGPYCTLMLADLGAAVFKLEDPGGGDMARGWGPPFAGNQASVFLGLNRGKYGVSIDLKRPAGIELCLGLIERMDVVVENFRPGTMDRLGLGYGAASRRNPRIVYCSISGYGQEGPSRDRAAMDLVVECSSGFMSITGTEAGECVRSGYAVADINAGLFSAIGILTALRARDISGRGQYVDVSMFDAMISAMTSNYLSFLGSGNIPGPMGGAFPTLVPYRVFEARDRPFGIAVGSEKLWASLCDAIGRADLKDQPDYSSNGRRVENRHALEEILAAVFRERDMSEWMERLGSAGVPCSPIRNFAEVASDPQSAVRNMFPIIDCPVAGPHRVTGPAIKLSETPAQIGAPAPQLGEHTETALAEFLGLERREIAALADEGVILLPAKCT